MYNHYGKYLPFAGNPIKYQSSEIELMIMRKIRLEKELNDLKAIIEGKEKDFEDTVREDWSDEEITEAKLKAIV